MNVVVKTEEIIWVVMRLYGRQALPVFTIGLGNAIAFVRAHKVDVNTGSHGGAQFSKQIARAKTKLADALRTVLRGVCPS